MKFIGWLRTFVLGAMVVVGVLAVVVATVLGGLWVGQNAHFGATVTLDQVAAKAAEVAENKIAAEVPPMVTAALADRPTKADLDAATAALKADLAKTTATADKVAADTTAINTRIDALQSAVDASKDLVARVDAIDNRFTAVEESVATIGKLSERVKTLEDAPAKSSQPQAAVPESNPAAASDAESLVQVFELPWQFDARFEPSATASVIDEPPQGSAAADNSVPPAETSPTGSQYVQSECGDNLTPLLGKDGTLNWIDQLKDDQVQEIVSNCHPADATTASSANDGQEFLSTDVDMTNLQTFVSVFNSP